MIAFSRQSSPLRQTPVYDNIDALTLSIQRPEPPWNRIITKIILMDL